MQKHSRIALGASIILAAVGCAEKTPKDEYRFIECVRVEGTCFENHVRQSAPYSGDFVHWQNVTKNQHARYGSVHHSVGDLGQLIAQQIREPHKYYPPYTVSFDDIPEEDFSKPEVTLRGPSEHLAKGDAEEGAQYEATCTLTVTERLDHNPSTRNASARDER